MGPQSRSCRRNDRDTCERAPSARRRTRGERGAYRRHRFYVGAARDSRRDAGADDAREIARAARPHLRASTDWIICAKGIERGPCLLSDIVREQAAARPAILSGPSFAADVAAGLPTAVTLAAESIEKAETLCRLLDAPTFRLYRSADIRGVEIGGAAKNVLAIACGVASGRGLGASAVAALTARCFAELTRFGRVFGRNPKH